MIRRYAGRALVWVGAGLVAAGLVACSQQDQQASTSPSQVVDRNFSLTPASAMVKASFLTGELRDMTVQERVEQGTGKVVDPPKLRATLKLKNTSENQAVRPVSGTIEYVDAEGKPIRLAENRGDATFKFSSYQERLDPGMEVTQNIEVPFPVEAIKGKKLRDIRLELAYIPTPYKEETVSIPVSMGQ